MGYMTNGLTFNDLRSANIARMERAKKFKKCRKWTRAQWMMALLGELGELANFLKKVDRGDRTLTEAGTDIQKELADVQIYLDLLAWKCGVDLGNATIAKFNEVSERVGTNVWLEAGDWKLRE